MEDFSMWAMFAGATLTVKLVMLLLVVWRLSVRLIGVVVADVPS